MNTDLKPCPFCGAPAELCSPDHEIEVRCTQCAARVENAPEFWNTRALASPQDVGERATLQQIADMAKDEGDLNWGHAQDAIDIAKAALASVLSTPFDPPDDAPTQAEADVRAEVRKQVRLAAEAGLKAGRIEGLEAALLAVANVALPADYIWSDSNRRKFDFGVEEAGTAIRNLIQSSQGGAGK